MTDTNQQLRNTADHIRALAKTAANDIDGNKLCCWADERIGGHERVIQIRTFTDGTTDQDIIAVPAESGIAEHIALWDPTNAVAVAELLEAISEPSYKVPDMVYWRALTLAKLLTADGSHQEEGTNE